jgi:Beta-galactosidase/beta-glucuronidase
MKRIDKEQNWKMRIVGEDKYISSPVPGSVYNDLLMAGRMEDPYFRDNEMSALELMKNDFEYYGTFDVDMDEVCDADEVILRFNGLDTIADIELNGRSLGSVNNMHRIWEYSVKDILQERSNKLVILFHSPVKYIAEQHKLDPGILGTEDAMKGFPKIRKAHYMFGWDWGPRLPDAGIWKSVELLAVKKARIVRSYIHQEFSDNLESVRLDIDVDLIPTNGKYISKENCIAAENSLQLRVTIDSPDGNRICSKELSLTKNDCTGKVSFTIENPQLWWPNGFGEQPLYKVLIELLEEKGELCDSIVKRIGLRKMEMSTVKDEYGSEFAHKVNDVKFFAMGADYIPEDNILSRTNRERTRNLLEQCKAAHFNVIRVWGGGLYPSDDFYEACDELGLVVWQDFMFSCANYRLTKEFEENISAEIRDQIRRLSHHASLGLWCGNNEMEMFAAKGEWGADDEIRKDYLEMYERLIPKILESEDPDRFYWPASPSSCGGFDDPNSPDRGDVHYWDVWHGNKPFTEYRKFLFRYLSEFGFQSFPSMRTIESFTLPEDRNVFSYVMEKHQRNAAANGKIMNYLGQTYRYPADLDTFVYATQLLQAEAIRYGVEHFRRNRGRCMGTVYWQLNDCWPVASWSSIDYYGRWKALHYFAKRFFAPFMISCEEEGLLTQTANVNAEPFTVKKSIRLNAANETRELKEAVIRWQLRDNYGSVISEEETEISVPALSSVWCDTVNLPEAKLYENYVSYQLCEKGEVISEGTVLFCPPKHFKFTDPELSVRAEGEEIIVLAEHFAKGVEIRNENDDLILSDNFFDMNGGEKRVKVIKGSTEGLSVRSVYNIQ